MKMLYLLSLGFTIISLFMVAVPACSQTYAQDTSNTQTAWNEISDTDVHRYRKGLDFLEKRTHLVLRPQKDSDKNQKSKVKGFKLDKNLLAVVAICVLALLGFLLYRQYKNEEEIPHHVRQLDDIDDIVATDLESMLYAALQDENYRMAMRIQFLMILKELELKKLISWHKYKTNRHYLKELSQDYKDEFKKLSNVFDRVWYGLSPLSETQYHYITQRFATFKNSIHE